MAAILLVFARRGEPSRRGETRRAAPPERVRRVPAEVTDILHPTSDIYSAMPILIAEDNVAQRHYLKGLLEREFAAHAPVIEAEDGEAALSLALRERPELCVFDIQMPRLSGVKAARAVW